MPLSPDVQAAIEAGSNLLTRKMQLEIALQVKGRWLAERSEELARLRSELDEVNSRLGELPVLNVEFARLVRDVKVHEQVYSFLRAEYEQSKIREQEDTPTLTLVDRAVPLELRARPRRKLMVMTAVLVAGLLAVLGTLGTTYVELLPPAGRRRRLLGATGAELRRLLFPGRRAT